MLLVPPRAGQRQVSLTNQQISGLMDGLRMADVSYGMKKQFLTLVGIALLSTTMAQTIQPGQQAEYSKSIVITETIGYLFYAPDNAAEKRTKKLPLVVFLHGAGERGNDLERVKKHGPPKKIAQGAAFPFFVLSPQCPEDRRWNSEKLYELISYIVDAYPVDPGRIYLTGLSMGGYGTWDLLASYPDLFAAAVPICGGGAPWVAAKVKDIPIWVFHGAKDKVVPLSESEVMVEAIKNAGGNVRFTVYPDAAHDSWTETYDNPEVYNWLLQQSK